MDHLQTDHWKAHAEDAKRRVGNRMCDGQRTLRRLGPTPSDYLLATSLRGLVIRRRSP
jgi:hypothetical protein